MGVGDIVLIRCTRGTIFAMEQNGKLGLVVDRWESPSYLGGDVFLDVMVDGVKMSFVEDELLDAGGGPEGLPGEREI